MKVLRWIDKHLEEALLVTTLTYITICMMVQIFMRHVVGQSLSWSEESIRFVFVWMIFLGFGIGVRENKHICIVALKSKLSPKKKLFLEILSNIIFLAYSIFFVYYGVEVVKSFMAMGQRSPALNIPMVLVYLAAPVGFLITTIRLIQSTYGMIKKYKLKS